MCAVTIAAVDVDYRSDRAVAACLTFQAWSDGQASGSWTRTLPAAAEYRPGSFYTRELPCLLAALEPCGPLEAVLVDGFVWLGEGRPGLGARLYEAIGGAYPVVGVAKNPFRGAPAAAITRGGSARPLYITAVGLATSDAAARVESMHGPHRIPTLLKAVDRLCRDG